MNTEKCFVHSIVTLATNGSMTMTGRMLLCNQDCFDVYVSIIINSYFEKTCLLLKNVLELPCFCINFFHHYENVPIKFFS